jgi:CopG family transcriptional regulator, nickel-responsive regulator
MSISIISISLPTELLAELYGILGDKSANRSEVLRQAVRSYITEYKELDNVEGTIIAIVSVLY